MEAAINRGAIALNPFNAARRVVVPACTLGIGQESTPETVPQFSKIEDYNRDTATDGVGQALEVKHGSGEVVATGDLRVIVQDAVVRDSSGVVADAELISGERLSDQVGEEWNVGEWIVFSQETMRQEGGSNPVSDDSDHYLDLRDATLKIVWVPQNEGTSEVLWRWQGPNAD